MTQSDSKLFAVYLGGRAPKCNIELHDVAFVVGTSIEETYTQLLDDWFGSPENLHLNSWFEVRVVDGHALTLSEASQESTRKLYFVNVGGYLPNKFIEFHEAGFVVAETLRQAKDTARQKLLVEMESVHTDDVFDVDDCIEISRIGRFFVHLEPTDAPDEMLLTNGYHITPRPVAAEWLRRTRHENTQG